MIFFALIMTGCEKKEIKAYNQATKNFEQRLARFRSTLKNLQVINDQVILMLSTDAAVRDDLNDIYYSSVKAGKQTEYYDWILNKISPICETILNENQLSEGSKTDNIQTIGQRMMAVKAFSNSLSFFFLIDWIQIGGSKYPDFVENAMH